MKIVRSSTAIIVETITSPIFILLTLVGNGLIGLVGFIFYAIESGQNPKIQSYMDALWWSFATATTTGYGDITPATVSGKILGIFTMLLGMALFAIYTALFADAFLSIKSSTRQ